MDDLKSYPCQQRGCRQDATYRVFRFRADRMRAIQGTGAFPLPEEQTFRCDDHYIAAHRRFARPENDILYIPAVCSIDGVLGRSNHTTEALFKK